MKIPSYLFGFAALLAGVANSHGSVIVTYAESPNAVNSTLSGTQVFDFNTTSLGKDVNVSWSGVGTFNQLYIKTADQYGGAADPSHPNGSRYSLQGAGSGVNSTTLKLDHASSYFGMWWSAGDAWNVLDFYKGNTLLGEFTTASLLNPLPSTYDGNPRNRSLDSGEPFAFINFFGDTSTAWDSIVLHNANGSGFESDNYTSRVAAWNPGTDGKLPGVAVAQVTGTTSTPVTPASLAGTRWAQTSGPILAPPGAPAPPALLLGAFGLIAAARSRKQPVPQA